jgi:hypothetical protein
MACACKNENSGETKGIGGKISNNIFFKLILFGLSMVVLPFVFPVIIVMLFNTIVLGNNNINIPQLLKKIVDKKQVEEDYIEEEEINPDDYEIMGVEVIN